MRMEKYYYAVTYDVCKHDDFCIDMNEYPVEAAADMKEQAGILAYQDKASLVRIYETDTGELEGGKLYKEYTFPQYDCGCGGE